MKTANSNFKQAEYSQRAIEIKDPLYMHLYKYGCCHLCSDSMLVQICIKSSGLLVHPGMYHTTQRQCTFQGTRHPQIYRPTKRVKVFVHIWTGVEAGVEYK